MGIQCCEKLRSGVVFLRKRLEDSPDKALPGLAILRLVLKLVLSCYVPTLILGVKTRTYS